ncbi:hypothetical protein [Deinococcus sp. ME38]
MPALGLPELLFALTVLSVTLGVGALAYFLIGQLGRAGRRARLRELERRIQ